MEAPLGTAARKVPREVITSTSTVGLPLESIISRALMFWMPAIYYLVFSGDLK